jgi:hypothetical protein
MLREKIKICLPRIRLSVTVEKVGWRISDQRQVRHTGRFPEIDFSAIGRNSTDVGAHSHDAERQLNNALTRHAAEHLKCRRVSEIYFMEFIAQAVEHRGMRAARGAQRVIS